MSAESVLFESARRYDPHGGEALGLRWEDIDLDSGTLRVHHALQRVEGVLRLVEPKTARSRRTIALPAIVVKALRAHRVRQLQERLLAGSRWKGHRVRVRLETANEASHAVPTRVSAVPPLAKLGSRSPGVANAVSA